MVVIGFDPGSIIFGIGVLKKEHNCISYLHSEELALKDKDFYAKMKVLWQHLETLYQKFPIDCAAIEEGFLGKNVKAMNVLSKVRGVVLGSLLSRGIDLKSYSPREVKLALTNSGDASKIQVKNVVNMLLKPKSKIRGVDESDALAVAFCHLLRLK
ncbi:MAG: crossover junction endodeoxyribonuclease RuvC [Acidobacteria bacterium]|jgi:crossover junction endodeoxyribonuclease RuvC|nr:crossover junction endodeoxyribonuclease RuvC [Acidobacteriota bacterium]